jgi:predicted amidohydrolase YtcJ
MKTKTTAVLLHAATLLVAASALPQTPEPERPVTQLPDIIYFHGDILTGAHLLDPAKHADPSPTPARVTAIAIRRGTILAVGTDADILKLKSTNAQFPTEVIDLNGAFAMPGFNDAHTHMANAGHQTLAIDLTGSASLAEMLDRIRAAAAKAPAGSWLQGGGWDHTLWANSTLPSKVDLDKVTAGHPAIFRRVDEHMAVANSAALAAANITAATPDPAGAKIDRGANREPTGILREAAATALVFSKIPPPTLEQRRQALTVAIDDALAHGVTSVQDNSEWDDFLALEELEKTRRLPIRVAEWLDFNQPVDVLIQRRGGHAAGDPLLHLTQLKGFMDGSLGSRTAALAEPYADDPANSGIPRYQQDKLNQMTSERAAAGFQIGFHAIGDEANTMALNAFSAAEQVVFKPKNQNPVPDNPSDLADSIGSNLNNLRFRIEHAQVLLPADFDRFAKLGVIASMQPSHLLTDMKWAAARLGPERVKYSYAWRSMLDHGVTLAFGTDYPVESINPFRGLYAAVTRMNEAGTQTFQPQEKITLAEAIYAYTQAPAFAEFRDTVQGRLEPGFFADMVVLDRDPTKVTPQELLNTKVLRTIVNGQIVYEAPAH